MHKINNLTEMYFQNIFWWDTDIGTYLYTYE